MWTASLTRPTGRSTCAPGTSTTATSPSTRYATPISLLSSSHPSTQVYGPHTSVLYARAAALENSLSSLGHHFLKIGTKPYKLQPGGPGYELTYACTGVPPYIRSLTPEGTLEAAWAAVAQHEQKLLVPLLNFLQSKASRGVRIVGQEDAGLARVPTVSFVVVGDRAIRSPDVVRPFDAKGNVGAGIHARK